MFYDRFKQLCDMKGVRPTNACIEAGVSRGLAAKWKAEQTEVPRADILQKLSAYFGMTIDEILGDGKNEQKENPGIPKDTEVDPIRAELLNLIEDATAAERKYYLDILRVAVSRHEKG